MGKAVDVVMLDDAVGIHDTSEPDHCLVVWSGEDWLHFYRCHKQLLEACQAARKLFDQGCVDRGFQNERNWIDDTLDKIDDAIFEATGEQP